MYKPPIATLVRIAEDMFFLDRGDICNGRKPQPLVYIRSLVCLVASDRGFLTGEIGKVLGLDRTTVYHHNTQARRQIKKNSPWWVNAKAALVDAWFEEMGWD